MLKQILMLIAGLLACCAPAPLKALDVSELLVSKGLALVQTNSGTPGLDTVPYEGIIQVLLTGPGTVSSVSVHVPAHSTDLILENQIDQFVGQESFATKATLDAALPSGAYLFHIHGTHDGLISPSLTLSSDNYPNNPQIANWLPLQSINAENNFSIAWVPFTAGTAQDYIQVRIYDPESGYEFFASPDYGQAGYLNGLATSVNVPVGTIFEGGIYEVELLFMRVVSVNTAAYPGAKGLSGFYKTTRCTLQTINPAGVINFESLSYSVYEHEGAATIRVERVGGSIGATSVGYSTSDGTAIGGPEFSPNYDYQTALGTLEFGNGETSKTFQVTIFDDNASGPTKTVRLQIYQPTGQATLGLQDQALLNILDNEAPLAPNASSYLVGKGQQFVQPGPGAPVLAADAPPYRFIAALEPTFSNSIQDVAIILPNNFTRALNPSADGLMFQRDEGFLSKALLDSTYANGNYRFVLSTLNQGLKSPTLTLTGDVYPPTPHFANWLEAQEIEPASE
ncbi:MAG TPA: Calx-beta domain-containing protein, partial [Candidatus Saccharimonadales bacterium]|nr:Calx-beta domain-containing protein [Candidatus Saccharimonadales bacterium]